MASVKNLASGTLVSGINTTDTSLTVNVGNGTSAQLLGVWPSVPFYITVAPSSPSSGVTNSLDSEIMLVTAISAGTNVLNMTVTRAQRDTTAKAFNTDDIVTNAVYAEDAVLLAPNGTTEPISPWIETSDIKDSQVTNSKIADGTIATAKFATYAVNEATKTANNISVSEDTPTGWAAVFGDGYYWTYYNTSTFANQPSSAGFLETIITGNQVYQRWKEHANGVCYYRGGNATGWDGRADGRASFRTLLDNKAYNTSKIATNIASGSDLNTLAFIQPGTYVVDTNTTAGTLAHCPTGSAFRMEVYNLLKPDVYITSSSTWVNVLRVITDWSGTQYEQLVSSNGDNPPVFSYGYWSLKSRANYKPGNSGMWIGNNSTTDLWLGRAKNGTGNYTIDLVVDTPRDIAPSVSQVTFTPNGYNEAFYYNGVLYSVNNPTTSQLEFSCTKHEYFLNKIQMKITVKTGTTPPHNSIVGVGLSGYLSFS